MLARQLTGDTGSTATVQAGGQLTLLPAAAGSVPAASPSDIGIGAQLTLRAAAIRQAGNIDLASGRLTLQASQGDVQLAAGSRTRLAGVARSFDTLVRHTAGGQLLAEATAGNLLLAAAQGPSAAAWVDVGAGAGAQGGSISLRAAQGHITLGGTLLGQADSGRGASLALDARQLPELATLAEALAAAPAAVGRDNFGASIDLRARSGDLTLGAGSTLRWALTSAPWSALPSGCWWAPRSAPRSALRSAPGCC